MSYKLSNVHLSNFDRNFECAGNDTVLNGGLRNGLAMHHECRNGTCGTCLARLVKGNLDKTKHHDFILSDIQKENNEFLMCCNTPVTDISIETKLIGDVRSIPIQSIVTKVISIDVVNFELAVIKLRTPRSKTLQFMAGQDVLLSFDDHHYSRYPLASCPCDGMILEFHISRNAKDIFAEAIFNGIITIKSLVNLQGPKGIFVLNEKSSRPMTFIAWETGFAAIRSLIEHAFSLEMSNAINFYWAYSHKQSEPYLDKYAKSWQVIMDDYSYTAIASDHKLAFDRYSVEDCQSLAEEIFEKIDVARVNQSDVYLAAPAELLITLSELLLDNGLNEQQLIASPL